MTFCIKTLLMINAAYQRLVPKKIVNGVDAAKKEFAW